MIHMVILLLLLSVLAIEDFRHSSIPMVELAVFYVVCIVIAIWHGNGMEFRLVGIGGLITIGCLMFSTLTGMFGKADAVIIGGICTAEGIIVGIQMFLVAITLMSFYSIVLLLRKKIRMKSEVPFVPFLFLAWMGVVACV